ncbi:MAG TPA: septum formation protein Maf [Candidatus Choladousia intestinavium]|uniref:dTTP/UTP pyrophosphatase n=1 Tax=Candidatus Choladousia intestinavium TaxID=2840727 RepID=A0A9D1AEJ7_9FIRM|nr:septum formation protein Maf [Candidatus Choladousia intestinavium]
MRKIVLASNSPRRKELLRQIGLKFQVKPAKGEEIITKETPWEIAEELSEQKALETARSVEEGIIIGADTLVWQDGKPMGKPKTTEDAAAMLQALQGRDHFVYTGVTVLIKEENQVKRHVFSRKTRVRVFPMTEKEIWDYIRTGEPMDKAGAYGIQGAFAAWIDEIEGDYNTVVGLPVSALWQVLKEYLAEE